MPVTMIARNPGQFVVGGQVTVENGAALTLDHATAAGATITNNGTVNVTNNSAVNIAAGNRSTRLFPVSVTQRLPVASKASPVRSERESVLAETPPVLAPFALKVVCPMIMFGNWKPAGCEHGLPSITGMAASVIRCSSSYPKAATSQ